jgi:hypothetical protein
VIVLQDVDTAVRENEIGFFQYVWRFNALAIAVAAVVCIILGFYAAAMIFKQETRPRRVTNVVNVGEQQQILEEFTLGAPGTIAGTDYVRVPLYRGQSYSASSASYYSKNSEQNVVNYLFLNTSTNESRWLLENTGHLLMSSQVLSNKLKTSSDDQIKAVGIIYTVVEKDSNGDNRLTGKDAISLAASAVDGDNYRKLLEGIERLYSVQQIADDKVLVLYQKNQQTVSELYSVPSMVRLMQATIPKVNLN